MSVINQIASYPSPYATFPLSSYAAVMVSPLYRVATKENTVIVKSPRMLYIKMWGVTIAGTDAADTVRLDRGPWKVQVVNYDGSVERHALR